MAQMNRSSSVFNEGLSLPSASAPEKKVALWIENNKSQILAVSGVLFFVVVSSFSFLSYQNYRNATAKEELRLGVGSLQKGDIRAAIGHLQTANERFGNGKAEGKIASFYLNEAYNQEKNSDLQMSDGFITDDLTGEPRDYLSQILILAQGRIAEKNRDFTAAQKFYEEASSIEGPFSSEALLGAERSAELANELNVAEALREKFIDTYPNSPFTEILRGKIGK